jgi:hypothetical protein
VITVPPGMQVWASAMSRARKNRRVRAQSVARGRPVPTGKYCKKIQRFSPETLWPRLVPACAAGVGPPASTFGPVLDVYAVAPSRPRERQGAAGVSRSSKNCEGRSRVSACRPGRKPGWRC